MYPTIIIKIIINIGIFYVFIFRVFDEERRFMW
jgi:hypothetical protein